VLDPQGPVSSAERLILLNATAIMLVVVLPVIILTLAFAWWYRVSNAHAAYRPDWSYSGHIELVVWSMTGARRTQVRADRRAMAPANVRICQPHAKDSSARSR
jgi:hypothetical protein